MILLLLYRNYVTEFYTFQTPLETILSPLNIFGVVVLHHDVLIRNTLKAKKKRERE